MPRLPRISGAETIRVLERLGFVQVRQRGSHVILKKTTATETTGCVVPLHSELAVGTLKGILKQARVGLDTFLKKVEGQPSSDDKTRSQRHG